MALKEFSIIPILGRKVDVPQNDPTLFKDFGGNIATHDVGGINFDLTRRQHSCAKSNGNAKWSNTVNATATNCLGLFELYDGTNRDHLYIDAGVVYLYDSDRDPAALTNTIVGFDSGGTDTPTIGETISENGGDASGILARYEVTSGAWADGDAAGKFYIQTTDGTWTNDAQLDGTTTGGDMATEDGVASSTTFATDPVDLYSMIRIGGYVAFTDRAESIPHKWKNGDQSLTPLDATGGVSGAGYKFRYLVSFARRVIGLYCTNDTGAPDLSIRWSSSWPSTSIANLNFSAADQLYVPNDDPIVGGATMGHNKCFIYCEDSIQQLVYYPNYDSPFQCFTVVPQIGAINHHSIINLGNRHLFFNRNEGFMEYHGTGEPVSISKDIDTDILGMIRDNANLIVGTYVPAMRCAVWTVPMLSSSTPNRLLFYNIDTKQWTWEDKTMRYVDCWQGYSSYTWIDLIRDLGGMNKSTGTADTDLTNNLKDSGADFVTTDGVIVGDEVFNLTDGTYGVATAVSATAVTMAADIFPDGDENYAIGVGATWADAGGRSWSYYTSLAEYLAYANTDGHLYNHSGEVDLTTADLDGHRIEPIMSFGNEKRKDLLKEVWFQFAYYGTHSIDIYWRGGDTVAEVTNEAWTSIGSIALNSDKPTVFPGRSARLHQIKWGTDSDSEYFEVTGITFKYDEQGEN